LNLLNGLNVQLDLVNTQMGSFSGGKVMSLKISKNDLNMIFHSDIVKQFLPEVHSKIDTIQKDIQNEVKKVTDLFTIVSINPDDVIPQTVLDITKKSALVMQ